MPGYTSVYSWVSLAIAALRVSPVGPIGLRCLGVHFLEIFEVTVRVPGLALVQSSGTRRRHRQSHRRRPSGQNRDGGGSPALAGECMPAKERRSGRWVIRVIAASLIAT
jgi:hypothetical protein